MEDWEKESQLQRAREEIFLVTLKDIMDYYKDSEGSHTFQGMFGCKISNNRSSGAFWRYAYDGQNFIEFNKEIPAWIPLDPAAANTKLKWEAEKIYTQRAKAYLEEECPTMLKRYLSYSTSYLDQKAPPTVTITSRFAPGGNRIFRCLAYDFYPPRISLSWNRASKMLALESEKGVFPNGNSTYLSWVEVEVPRQDGDPYFCHIEHSGLSQSLLVQWDETKKAKVESHGVARPQ